MLFLEPRSKLQELLSRARSGTAVPVDPSTEPRPWAILVCCCECGPTPEALFGQEPGSFLVISGAGIRADASVVAGVAFGLRMLQLRLVLVLGHTPCKFADEADTMRLQGTNPGWGSIERCKSRAARVAEQIARHPHIVELERSDHVEIVPVTLGKDRRLAIASVSN